MSRDAAMAALHRRPLPLVVHQDGVLLPRAKQLAAASMRVADNPRLAVDAQSVEVSLDDPADPTGIGRVKLVAVTGGVAVEWQMGARETPQLAQQRVTELVEHLTRRGIVVVDVRWGRGG